MSNMSYCRFQNTLSDFRDCVEAFEGLLNGEEGKLSDSEYEAARGLLSYAYDLLTLAADASGTSIEDLDTRDFDIAMRHAQNSASKEEA